MYEIIYLEPDAEITSVIDRLKSSESKAIALVVPRGATLAQSIVNLKLLKRSAAGIKRQIAIISTDKISRNLAAQVGLSVFSKVEEAEKATPSEEDPVETSSAGGFKVNNYYNRKAADLDPESDEESEEEQESVPVSDDEDEEEALKAEVRRNLEEVEEEPEEEDRSEASPKPTHQVEQRESHPKSSKSKVELSDGDQENEEDQEEIDPKSKDKDDKTPAKIGGSRKILFVIAGIVIVLGLIGAYILVPYANARVIMKTEDSKFEKEITVDADQKSVDVDTLKIPGQVVEIEKTMNGNFSATGTKDMGEKATGKITVTNSGDSSFSTTLAKGARFVAGDKVFISTQDASVPKASATCNLVGGTPVCTDIKPGVVEVSVQAEKSGDTYNIGPSDFVISSLPSSKQKVITGKSSAAMAGGVTKQVQVVQDSDLTGAEKKLIDDAKKTSAAEVQQKAGEASLVIFADSIKSEVVSSTSSKKEGDETDKFDYQVKVRFYVLGYLPADLTKLATDSVGAGLTGNQMIVSPENSKLETALISSDVDGGIEKIKATGQFKIGNNISEGEVVKKIKGKKIGTAKNMIESIDGVSSSDIKIRPSLIKQVPFLDKRIKVEFGFATDDVSGN